MVPILCQSLPKSVPKQVLHVISDQFKVNWISGLENKINTKKKDKESIFFDLLSTYNINHKI